MKTALLAIAFVLVVSVLHGQEVDDDDYYAIMELPNKDDSTDKEIKKQFRLLSKKFHPDHNPSDEAKEKYKKIQRAHDVLSDRKKRRVYDKKGAEGIRALENGAFFPEEN